jgi:hypothetical protein
VQLGLGGDELLMQPLQIANGSSSASSSVPAPDSSCDWRR